MATVSFDTHEFIQELKAADFTEKQAEAMSRAQKRAISELLEAQLATKSDIHDLRMELVKQDAKIDKLSWMMGILIAIALANFAKQFF